MTKQFGEIWACKRPGCASALRRWPATEDGSMTIVALFFFVVMIMIGGISVDIMLHENDRLRLQNLSDRAAIAAADLSQTLDPEEVVRSHFEKEGLSAYLEDTIVEDIGNSRRVRIVSSRTEPTLFMNMSGVHRLHVPAAATAQEGISDVEISLVLDVSNSMNRPSADSTRTKLQALQSAGGRFVDTVMSRDVGRTTISLVPYSTQVNLGHDIVDAMGVETIHDHSYCLQMEEADVTATALRAAETYRQSAHFDQWNSGEDPRLFMCRPDAEDVVRPLQTDAATIKELIDAMTADGNTSIEIGMNWGMAMLDPSFRPITAALADSGRLPDSARNRPIDWERKDTDKFVVLLTDGVNTEQFEITDAYASGPSGVWRWLPGDGQDLYSIALRENGDEDGDGVSDEAYWHPAFRLDGEWFPERWDDAPLGADIDLLGLAGDLPDATDPVALDWSDLWAEMTVKHFASEYVEEPRNDRSARRDFLKAVWTATAPGDKDSRLLALCNLARDRKVTVYTVGFQVTDHSASVLSQCASTPNHFIRVVDDDLEDAFEAIASDISKLKLIQ